MNAIGMLSTRQMCVLFGVSADDFQAEYARQHGEIEDGVSFEFVVPPAWVASGRARLISTGTTVLSEALAILAALDEIRNLPETP
ncbi:hypothetical protein [Embleya sp. NPDC020630]|uniref:hypothetical protein n=1 Tax=Embleya sp. NPDC020630 TaxID=3363979 RepID=UPI0037B7FCB0